MSEIISNSTEELENLACELVENIILEKYSECVKLTKHPNFQEFCISKGQNNYNALDYSILYGRTDIFKLLIGIIVNIDFINIELKNKYYNNGVFDFPEIKFKSIFSKTKTNNRSKTNNNHSNHSNNNQSELTFEKIHESIKIIE